MIDLIVASWNGIIGYDGELVVSCKEDMRVFKANTIGKSIIMGRKTSESLPKKLPNRFSIVVSGDTSYQSDKADVVVQSVEEAFEYHFENGTPQEVLEHKNGSYGNLAVIGGESIYEQARKYVDRTLLTEYKEDSIDADHPLLTGDADFDKVSYLPEWIKECSQRYLISELSCGNLFLLKP
jgi:dihydrofolate reductase